MLIASRLLNVYQYPALNRHGKKRALFAPYYSSLLMTIIKCKNLTYAKMDIRNKNKFACVINKRPTRLSFMHREGVGRFYQLNICRGGQDLPTTGNVMMLSLRHAGNNAYHRREDSCSLCFFLRRYCPPQCQCRSNHTSRCHYLSYFLTPNHTSIY